MEAAGVTRTITVDVRRNDGDVARLEGDQAIAVAAKRPADDAKLGDVEPGLVSLRCDDEMGLAICLASILAAVVAVAPGAVPLAADIAKVMDGSNPDLRRVLPPLQGECDEDLLER